MIHKHRKLLIISSILLLFFCHNILMHTFSTRRWQRYPEKRVDMVDDLLAKHELIGMTKEEIVLLLGETTETEYFKTDNNMVYYLGPERGLIRIDSEWLVLEVQNNHVAQVDIFRD